MPFMKAEPKQARLKVSLYGSQGSGKTLTTLLFAEGIAKITGKRIAYVDTERGTDFYAKAVPERRVHPEAFDFDALYTRSLAQVIRDVKSLDPEKYSVVVIDSISHMWEAAIEAYEGRKTRAGTIPMHAWGTIKKPYKDLIKWLMESPFHVFILGRQKNVFEDDERGEMKKVGVAMKAEGETPYEPHICLHMYTKAGDQSGSMAGTVYLMPEKDRSGVLTGREIPNPNYGTIEPIVHLLSGDEQAVLDDEDQRLADDGELQAELEGKRQAREQKSAELSSQFNSEIAACTSVEQLGAVGESIKKKRRSLTDEHRQALLMFFQEKRRQLVEGAAEDF